MNTMNSTLSYLQAQRVAIEGMLDHLLQEKEGCAQILIESARYAILGGGKRLRPLLTLATTEMLNGNGQLALKPACTLELIHSYSLIHDDLPCMDNDDYRRNQLTVHKKFSEAQAVLTGDFLLTYAFEILATDPLLSADMRCRLISILAHQSGNEGMIGGQVMDIQCEGKEISIETLRLLHQKKTGALITAAIEFGGVIANASLPHLESLKAFGNWIGLAFQVVDDILDVTSNQKKYDEALSSDIRNEKSTYVTVLGLDKAQAYAENCFQEALCILQSLPYDTSILRGIAETMIHRKI